MSAEQTGAIPTKATPEKKATPWLGIGAVMIGLSTSVFVGQLVAIGASDLQGAQHLSKDQASWLTAVYNAGQMFIGPLTVYMGGLLGPRKVLLFSAPLVAFSALLLGFTTWYPLILVLLALAGLGCGTFYPLTLSFVARSLPKKYILFGFAAYGFDIVSSLHVASLLEGFYMQYLSWHWIYWQPALMALGMWLLVYAGMPPDSTAAVDTQKLRPTWQGLRICKSWLDVPVSAANARSPARLGKLRLDCGTGLRRLVPVAGVDRHPPAAAQFPGKTSASFLPGTSCCSAWRCAC